MSFFDVLFLFIIPLIGLLCLLKIRSDRNELIDKMLRFVNYLVNKSEMSEEELKKIWEEI